MRRNEHAPARGLRRLAALAACAVFAAPSGRAQDWGGVEEALLIEAGQFGSSVGISGDVAAGARPGRVRIYERSGATWSHAVTFFQASTSFGADVDVSGTTVAVARSGDAGTGAVHVYVRGGAWTEQAVLGGPTEFLDLDGDTLAVGSTDAEAVDVYVRNGTTWSLQAHLTAFDGRPGYLFGFRVGLDGDTLIAAAAGDESFYAFVRSGATWSLQQKILGETPDPLCSGIAIDGDTALLGSRNLFVFTRSGGLWTQGVQLEPPLGLVPSATFGSSFDVEGDLIAVGAHDDNSFATDGGSVYLYRLVDGVWRSPTRIVGSTTGEDDSFGAAVAVSQGSVVVGSPGAASAFVFRTFDLRTETETHALTASDAEAGDGLGGAVAADGSTLLAGAELEDGSGVDAGAAYVFAHGGGVPGSWTEEAKLVASDGEAGDLFGCAVALGGDLAVVGARGDDDLAEDAGAVYVFERGGTVWTQTAKLGAPDGGFEDEFGSAVALDGERLVIGAPRETNLGGFRAGSVYVFDRVGGTWTFRKKLRAASGMTEASFGEAVDVLGETVAVGAFRHGSPFGGRAYVFEEAGGAWPEQATLLPSTSASRFGAEVALGTDRLLVGAPGSDSGSLFVFTRSGTAWTERSRTRGVSPAAGDSFGGALAWTGERVVVGASGYDADVAQSGLAYAYTLAAADEPDFDHLLSSAAPQGGAELGRAVAASERFVVTGAPSHDAAAPDAGALFVFANGVPFASFCDASDGALAACPCVNPGLPDTGCDIAQGTGGLRLDVLAQETGAQNRATLFGSGYPAMSAPGVTVIRSAGLESAAVVFGDGLRCIAVPVVRVGATLGAGGTSTQTVGHGAAAGPGTFYYQLWVRNTPAMFCTPDAFNLSNGRSIVW